LPQEVARALYTIHHPTPSFYQAFLDHGGLWGEYLYALKFAEALAYLRRLQKRRIRLKALTSCKGDPTPFISQLPFQLTKDQERAIQQIQEDLASPIAAKRIIVGDVGSGKSVVIFAAAYLAYPNRSILMAPTTILATQLYHEARRLLPSFISIGLVTSKSDEQDLSRYHFIIGTQALLYRKLPKACLVMVDEQHRFGTEQRERLKRLVQNRDGAPHFLQFSATPIPRTQAMIESALVDITLIQESPFQRKVETRIVSRSNFKELLHHIYQQIEEGNQVIVVYPLVEEGRQGEYKSLHEAEAFWKRLFPGRVQVTHGRDGAKEEVLERFRREGAILLTTTLIEVGISLPRLSTIVIVGAERLGLATLHQLRGRVGRDGRPGYCFLYTNDPANKRLKAFAKIESGFEVAELDLRFRKSGDILEGKEQSGKAFQWLSLAEDGPIVEAARKLV
jgi:ATP-dependent DNA helicase RecG